MDRVHRVDRMDRMVTNSRLNHKKKFGNGESGQNGHKL